MGAPGQWQGGKQREPAQARHLPELVCPNVTTIKANLRGAPSSVLAGLVSGARRKRLDPLPRVAFGETGSVQRNNAGDGRCRGDLRVCRLSIDHGRGSCPSGFAHVLRPLRAGVRVGHGAAGRRTRHAGERPKPGLLPLPQPGRGSAAAVDIGLLGP